MVGSPDPSEPTPDALVRVVAVDGPAGSGKTSVAREVAKAIGWRFVDTGATYRAVTLAVLRAGVTPEDTEVVVEVARRASIQLSTDGHGPAVLLDGEDVSDEIRGPAVTAAVSAVSAIPAVRQVLIGLQRAAMGVDGAVVEGRDIATVVAPRAAVKVYLDATPEVRARRRAGEQSGSTNPMATRAPVREDEVQRALLHRDRLDNQTNRLEASDGAVHIETSDMTLEEVVAAVVTLTSEAGLLPQHHDTPSGTPQEQR